MAAGTHLDLNSFVSRMFAFPPRWLPSKDHLMKDPRDDLLAGHLVRIDMIGNQERLEHGFQSTYLRDGKRHRVSHPPAMSQSNSMSIDHPPILIGSRGHRNSGQIVGQVMGRLQAKSRYSPTKNPRATVSRPRVRDRQGESSHSHASASHRSMGRISRRVV